MSHFRFSAVRAHEKPSPPRLRGGEGWVRGQRVCKYRHIRNATSSPLTPTFSPKHSLAKREPTASEAA
jgi:hypothetical protein